MNQQPPNTPSRDDFSTPAPSEVTLENLWPRLRAFYTQNAVKHDGFTSEEAETVARIFDDAESSLAGIRSQDTATERAPWLSPGMAFAAALHGEYQPLPPAARLGNHWQSLFGDIALPLSHPKDKGAMADFWLAFEHRWRSPSYAHCKYPDQGVTWSIAYTIFVALALAVDIWAFATHPISSWPLLAVAAVLPLAIAFPILKRASSTAAAFLYLAMLIPFIAARAWLWNHDTGASVVLVAAVSFAAGLYLILFRGAWRRVLKNADRYGPFACVWMRPAPGAGTGKVEYVLTDSDGEIVWIRTAGKAFSEQFVYEYPGTDIHEDLGIEGDGGWRKVFPALFSPRETVRDWERWKHGVPGDEGEKRRKPNSFRRENVLPVPSRAWQSWILRDTLLFRPRTLSEAMTLAIPGLTPASAEAFILAHGMDTEPSGYAQALETKTVAPNAPY